MFHVIRAADKSQWIAHIFPHIKCVARSAGDYVLEWSVWLRKAEDELTLSIALLNCTVQIYLPTKGGPVDTALVKVGGRLRHHKSGGPPVGRVEPVESVGGPVAYLAGPAVATRRNPKYNSAHST